MVLHEEVKDCMEISKIFGEIAYNQTLFEAISIGELDLNYHPVDIVNEGVGDKIKSAWEKFKAWVKRMIERVKKFFKTLKDKIFKFFGIKSKKENEVTKALEDINKDLDKKLEVAKKNATKLSSAKKEADKEIDKYKNGEGDLQDVRVYDFSRVLSAVDSISISDGITKFEKENSEFFNQTRDIVSVVNEFNMKRAWNEAKDKVEEDAGMEKIISKMKEAKNGKSVSKDQLMSFILPSGTNASVYEYLKSKVNVTKNATFSDAFGASKKNCDIAKKVIEKCISKSKEADPFLKKIDADIAKLDEEKGWMRISEPLFDKDDEKWKALQKVLNEAQSAMTVSINNIIKDYKNISSAIMSVTQDLIKFSNYTKHIVNGLCMWDNDMFA